MHEAALNPALVRGLLILLFLAMPYILRAFKGSTTAKPPARPAAAKATPLSDAPGEAKQPTVDLPPARQSERWADVELSQMREKIQLPPTIKPESSFVPSLLLLVLLACLCLMAYRYWAG